MQINCDKASDRVKKFLLVMVFTHQKWIESKQTKIFWQQNIGWNDVQKIIECKKCTDLPIYHTMKLHFVLTLTVLSRNLFVECIKSIKKEGHFNDIKTSLSL